MAEGPKKKIRIHLPQKVKHIHHHKKIYITNHPASTQYAPAFMPSAEGAVAVPTNVALPVVVPINSIEHYEESLGRRPSISTTGSKLLPMYRARGYYGPSNADWEDQEYDLVPPPKPNDSTYLPSAFAGSTEPQSTSIYRTPMRTKIVKMNEPKHKSNGRTPKPQRIIVKGRQQIEEEHPVSTFHEMFYSDLDGTGTIKKIKKPQRVEKIVDGDTEHIHTYSEEHIHKLIYDDQKIPNTIGTDQMSSMSGMTTAHQIIPIKTPQTLIAFPSKSLSRFPIIGSLGTPNNLEYAAYNPRDVTHDHIFHEHGEIPANIDIVKDPLSLPPKISYNSQGLRIGSLSKGFKNKHLYKYGKPTKVIPSTDLSYYENIFNPYNQPKNVLKPTISPPQYDNSGLGIEDYNNPLPSYNQINNIKPKTRNLLPPLYFNSAKQSSSNYLPQANFPSPFSVSSSVVHEYKTKNYLSDLPEQSESSKFKDPITNFKDTSYSNNYEYDNFASPSNVLTSEDNNGKSGFLHDKKKSVSSQNISFRGLDHQTTIDHLEDFGISAISTNEDLEDFNNLSQIKSTESATPTTFTIKNNSPMHPYYSAMALKALHGDLVAADASNNNFQYIQTHNLSNAYISPVATTSVPLSIYQDEPTTSSVRLIPAEYSSKPKIFRRRKTNNSDDLIRQSKRKYFNPDLAFQLKQINADVSNIKPSDLFQEDNYPDVKQTIKVSSITNNLKYGDKI